MVAIALLAFTALGTVDSGGAAFTPAELANRMLPRPRQITPGEGNFGVRGVTLTVVVPDRPEHEACRTVLEQSLSEAGGVVKIQPDKSLGGHTFWVTAGDPAPVAPARSKHPEAYAIAVRPTGIAADANSAAGLLYAAQTLRQLLRLTADDGQIPSLAIADEPVFPRRGIYIEGGQERFGKIVDPVYLREQVRRLSEFKMNTLVIECYNLFPFKSFPACADGGTLTQDDVRALVAEAKRYHVTIVPSLQTLAQTSELVWGCDAGKPYREVTAPGQICPSAPELGGFIKGLYRDLLQTFDDAPLLGVGCSEIDMQWRQRYCPRCAQRVAAGESVRDLMLGHAEVCIRAVRELSSELKRPVRPIMWADEFYMYGPGKDWVGIDRIPKETVMGFWKYWSDYRGMGGLMERGYDVLGISAMYNHTFYLADLSPAAPRKLWAPMEQTGTRNIVGLLAEAAATDRAEGKRGRFLGAVTASFSKHRLRAFDTIWYGFVLNADRTWGRPAEPIDGKETDQIRAFATHYYDARTLATADALGEALVRIDARKSELELANQSIHDVVGVSDTQEPGYQGNTLLGALRNVRKLASGSPEQRNTLAGIRATAQKIEAECDELKSSLESRREVTGNSRELGDLIQAAGKVGSHAQRQILLLDTQEFLEKAKRMQPAEKQSSAGTLGDRWAEHLDRVQMIASHDVTLDRRDDSCGYRLLQRDISTLAAHFAELARPQAQSPAPKTLLQEDFRTLDPARWFVYGSPRVAGGVMETVAPGGWEHRCGVATREPFDLSDSRPIFVEFPLTPTKMGTDSQLFESTTEEGADAGRFAFFGRGDRFCISTQAEKQIAGPFEDAGPGWKLRLMSDPVESGRTYVVRAEIRRRSVRFVIRGAADDPNEPPFWDTGTVAMDPMVQAFLGFCDLEPPDVSASTKWGPIHVTR